MTSIETSQEISFTDTILRPKSDDDEEENEIICVKKVKGQRKALIDTDDEGSEDERRSENPTSLIFNSENQDTSPKSPTKTDVDKAKNDVIHPEGDSSNELGTNSKPTCPRRDLDNVGNSSDSEDDTHKEIDRKGSGTDSESCEFSIDEIKSKYYSSKNRENNAKETKKTKKKNKTESEDDGDLEKQSKSRKPTVNRKAKLAAIEEIHSVTQRIVRESNASLPYHNPKQRSLEDFLNRRKTQPKVPLKTHVGELCKVWKFTEDQEKTAEIIYKSEDEDIESNASVANDNDPKNKTEEVIDETGIVEEKNESRIEEKDEPQRQEGEIMMGSETESFHLSELTEGFFIRKSVTEIEPLTEEEEAALEKLAEQTKPRHEDGREEPSKMSEGNKIFKNELFKNSVINLKFVPKLSGDTNGLIELDDFQKSGTLGFIKRYMKHSTLKPKEAVDVMTGQDNCVLENSVETNEKKSGPSKKLLALKANLHKKIAAMREEQLAKRVEEYKIAEEEFFGVEEEDGKYEELELDDKKEKVDDQVTDTDDDEGVEELLGDNDLNEDDDEEDEKDLPFLDNKAEEASEGEEKDESENEEIEEDGVEDLLSNEPMPNRLDLNLEDEVSPVKQSQLLDLCSGKFSSQPMKLNESEDEDEIIQTGSSPLSQPSQNILEDSDDEEDIIGPRHKKKVRKLSFSDDEDDDQNNDTVTNAPSEEEDGGEVVQEEEDEEENNELVEDEEEQLALQLGKDFLEGEAELSESEWGSADEDEGNLDVFEAEEGDREKFSQRQLRRELEQIHARELMVEDKRKIRIMQELFLEDGELHTDGPRRQRLFRWYNQDENDTDGGPQLAENNENDIGDDEDEETWRKGRIDRENFLRQQKIDIMECQDSELLSTTVRTVIVKSGTLLNETTNVAATPPAIIPQSPDVKKHFSLLTNRGSFLSRGDKILSKIAELTTGAGNGDARKMKGGTNRNMVFTVVSPEKLESKASETSKPTKRKAETPQGQVKKLKHATVKKPSFLDRLKDEDT